tara:strand:- start:4755 stop:5105 length:351 start_codon:yes stop_codon:yes gene_type:complete
VKRPNFFSVKSIDGAWDIESESYVRLWRGVLDQLLQDLLYEGNGKEDKKAHIYSWQWYENDKEDFELICDLSDLDAKRTRREINNLMEKVYGSDYKRKFRESKKAVEWRERKRIRK